MPHLCDKILEITENISKEEKVDQQLIYFLNLFRGLIQCNGSYLIYYKKSIIEILDRTLDFKYVDAYSIPSFTLKDILKSLTSIYELEFNENLEKSHMTVKIFFAQCLMQT